MFFTSEDRELHDSPQEFDHTMISCRFLYRTCKGDKSWQQQVGFNNKLMAADRIFYVCLPRKTLGGRGILIRKKRGLRR